MIIVVRHGKTKLNNESGERLRGWLNVPLSDDGKMSAYTAAKKLDDLNLNFKDFHTSPLMRAVQTSKIISSELRKGFSPTDKLKDWNVGNLTGKPVNETLPIIHQHLDNINEPIPGGESYKSFYDRTVPYLEKLAKDEDNHLVVTHNRVTTLLHAMSKNDPSLMKRKGPLHPGGIMMVHPDFSIDVIHKGEA